MSSHQKDRVAAPSSLSRTLLVVNRDESIFTRPACLSPYHGPSFRIHTPSSFNAEPSFFSSLASSVHVFVLSSGRPLQIVISMSVASWYFARNKANVGSLTVVASVGKTFVFHIGTAAFGALIVAIVEVSLLGWGGPGSRGVGVSLSIAVRAAGAAEFRGCCLCCLAAAFGLTASPPVACFLFSFSPPPAACSCCPDDPGDPDVHPEEGQGVRQLGLAVHGVLLRVLLLVPRELHPLHQQERIRAGV